MRVVWGFESFPFPLVNNEAIKGKPEVGDENIISCSKIDSSLESAKSSLIL